jgi:phenylalanine-4-hydroxylase
MRQNRAFFRTHAVAAYEKGLQKTGIPIDRIPRISEMDEKLSEFGWGAVAVNGFIPPSAFLEFQALGILAIACDMRTVEHIDYTPAPDIVHEAAGHAPILNDPAYAAYLKRYARVAQQAIFSREDIDLYEAIRYLSDIKENPDISCAEIERAEARFQAAYAGTTHVSEAAKVGRMAWWTVEYGLVGSIESPLIYGAGLLSSVGESQNCLSRDVKKIPLRLDCVEQGFDITKPQPQLFVARKMEDLVSVLEDLEKTMSFHQGGKLGLDRAIQSKTVNTVVLDSGLEIAGLLEIRDLAADDAPVFLKFSGPVQLAFAGKQLLGHGRSRHCHGFSSPLGRFAKAPEKKPHQLSDDDLNRIGLQRGRNCRLEFCSGFVVEGVVGGWHRENGSLVYISFRRPKVSRGDSIFFDPSWGDFDLGIGESVVSVRGGPANRDDYGDYDVGQASTKPGRASAFTDSEMDLFAIYQELRILRIEAKKGDRRAQNIAQLARLSTKLAQAYSSEWLASLELLEVASAELKLTKSEAPWLAELEAKLAAAAQSAPPSLSKVMQIGIKLSSQA